MCSGAVKLMDQNQAPRPLGWEHLVTEGHVRAARLRRVQPVMILAAVILMVLGLALFSIVKPPTLKNQRVNLLNAQIERQQRRTLEVFSGLPAPRIKRSALKDQMSLEALTDANEQILAELNRRGAPPTSLTIDQVSPAVFWRVAWPQRRIVMTGDSKVKLAGALINVASPDAPQAGRFLGIYRRTDGVWTMVTVEAPDFYGLAAQPSVRIETVPVTLRPLLKTKD